MMTFSGWMEKGCCSRIALAAGAVILCGTFSGHSHAFDAGPGPWQEVPYILESIDIGDQFPPAFMGKLEQVLTEWSYGNYLSTETEWIDFGVYVSLNDPDNPCSSADYQEKCWLIWSFYVIEAYHGDWWAQ